MYNYYECVEKEIRRDRAIERKMSRASRPMTANEWRFNDSGSCEPQTCSLENIFAAYHDYRNSQQWD